MSNRFAKIMAAAVTLSASAALAAPITYTDTAGDQVGSANKARDIQSVVVSNDASNLTFTVNLDPGADFSTTNNFNYAIGITSGPTANGDTAADATNHGNPYKRLISIGAAQGGMTNWIGVFGAGAVGTVYGSVGFNDYVWNSTTSSWGTAVDTVASGQPIGSQGAGTTHSTFTITVPFADLANLGLAVGSKFNFDVYSTGTSAGQGAYDSLSDPVATPGAAVQYDGTLLETYTVQAVTPRAGLAVSPRRRESGDAEAQPPRLIERATQSEVG